MGQSIIDVFTNANGQFSAFQEIELFTRLVFASICGALFGIERSRRYKDAGIRTHIILCCASALVMIVSKYGFTDIIDESGTLLSGVRGADAARIAAQVVSGISFLCAGVIFKHGNTVRGLNTAAGLWATAGVGLAVGAGMYVIGLFATVFIAIMQIVMKRYAVGADSLLTFELGVTSDNDDQLRTAWDQFVHTHRMQVVSCDIKYYENGTVSYDATVRTRHEITVQELDAFFQEHGKVSGVNCSYLG